MNLLPLSRIRQPERSRSSSSSSSSHRDVVWDSIGHRLYWMRSRDVGKNKMERGVPGFVVGGGEYVGMAEGFVLTSLRSVRSPFRRHAIAVNKRKSNKGRRRRPRCTDRWNFDRTTVRSSNKDSAHSCVGLRQKPSLQLTSYDSILSLSTAHLVMLTSYFLTSYNTVSYLSNRITVLQSRFFWSQDIIEFEQN